MTPVEARDYYGWSFPKADHFRPGEIVRFATRRHWVVLVWPSVLATAALLVVVWLWGLAPGGGLAHKLLLVAVLAVGLTLAWVVHVWSYGWFVITSARVMLFQDLFGQRKAMMPIARVTDVEYFSPPLVPPALQHCHLKIESAGQDQALHTVRFLAAPVDVNEAMNRVTSPVGSADLMWDGWDMPERPVVSPVWWVVPLLEVLVVLVVALG